MNQFTSGIIRCGCGIPVARKDWYSHQLSCKARRTVAVSFLNMQEYLTWSTRKEQTA